MKQGLAKMPLEEEIADDEGAPETVPVPRSLVTHLSESAILLDIDGTLLDLAPTPREVWVPPGLAKTLNRLLARTNGALALVSGRSLNDIDLIFAPMLFPAVGGHGAEMRIGPKRSGGEPRAADGQGVEAPPCGDCAVKPGNLLEDKGYSLALHYRLRRAEKAIHAAVSLIRADCRTRRSRCCPASAFARSSIPVSPRRPACSN